MKRLISKFFVLTTLMVVFGSQVAVADERPLQVGVFENGNLLCVSRDITMIPAVVEKCCFAASHDIIMRYTFVSAPRIGETMGTARLAVSCSPKKDPQVSMIQDRE